ncbi:MAG: hypothetical protein MPJ50_12880 [Pirellulales bacterium]|nr:hypothetical protein [Pirellulales bacterium]
MNSEQIANQIVMRFLGSLPKDLIRGLPDDHIKALRNCIRDVLGITARGEREACAQLAETLDAAPEIVQQLAEAIRNRRPKQDHSGSSKPVEGTPA